MEYAVLATLCAVFLPVYMTSTTVLYNIVPLEQYFYILRSRSSYGPTCICSIHVNLADESSIGSFPEEGTLKQILKLHL